MVVISNKSKHLGLSSQGFTLIELMIVVAIIGILAAIAYPSYQQYVIKTKRTDMMSEMQNIATQIQSRKLAQGAYSNALKNGLEVSYPKQGTKLYAVTITPDPLTSNWTITANPIKGTQMVDDGPITINYLGVKCRGDDAEKKCGTGDDWNN